MNQVDPTWNEVDQAGQDRPDHLNILCGLLVGNVSTPQCGGALQRGWAGRDRDGCCLAPRKGGISSPPPPRGGVREVVRCGKPEEVGLA